MVKRQQVLADFGEFALRSQDLDKILMEACRLVGEALGTGRAKVLEILHAERQLLVRAGWGGHGVRQSAACRTLVEATRQRLEQLPGVLEVAAPHQPHALTGQTEGIIGAHRVIDDHDAAGRESACPGQPGRVTGGGAFGPFQAVHTHGHCGARTAQKETKGGIGGISRRGNRI
jgi:hypothetical protein